MVNIDRTTIKKHAIMKLRELSRAQKLEILKEAKKMYVEKTNGLSGMCYCIDKAGKLFVNNKLEQDHCLYGFGYYPYRFLHDIFPEFNPIYLAGGYFERYDFWWPLNDSKSRIDAFDKLIKIYSTTI